MAWRYVIHSNSSFVVDVMFSYSGASGPKSSTTLCLEEVCRWWYQLDVKRTTVFDQVHQNVALGVKPAIYH